MFRLKFLRIDRGLTCADLAERTGVNRSTINNIENGRVNPRPDELAALGRALGCPAHRLLDHISDGSLGAGVESRDMQREIRLERARRIAARCNIDLGETRS